jgi:hypothetical protein
MFRQFLMLFATLTVSISSASDSAHAETREFRAEYRCEVVNRLERIYGFGDRSQHLDRFLAITVPEHDHGYVQCMFHGYVQCMFIENGKKLLCEASSGFFYNKPDEPRTYRLSAEKISELVALGFSSDDSQGNYRHERQVSSPPDFNRIADFLLIVLHKGYDAAASSKLEFSAPFARDRATTCVPVG